MAISVMAYSPSPKWWYRMRPSTSARYSAGQKRLSNARQTRVVVVDRHWVLDPEVARLGDHVVHVVLEPELRRVHPHDRQPGGARTSPPRRGRYGSVRSQLTQV